MYDTEAFANYERTEMEAERHEVEWDEYCPDCGTYGTHSSWDCARKKLLVNKK